MTNTQKSSSLARLAEDMSPIVCGVLGFVLSVLVPLEEIPDNMKDLYQAAMGIGAIVVGFLATAKSIIISVDDKPAISELKKIGHYSRLMGFFMYAIWTAFFVSVASAVLVICSTESGLTYRVLFVVWSVLLGAATAACVRVLRVFGMIVSIISK